MSPDYPMNTEEPQGLLIENDFVQFAGYTDHVTNATNHTYARDVTMANSPWRRMEDVPDAWGITHVPVVAVGSKAYLCGGYNGAAKGVHFPIASSTTTRKLRALDSGRGSPIFPTVAVGVGV
jgi:hypothetical protein